jgi:hypothetical protein
LCNTTLPKQLVGKAKRLSEIWKVPDSNFDWGSDYFEVLHEFFSVSPCKCHSNALK